MKDHQRSEWLHTEHSSASGDIFGDPNKKTRIGDEFQANIPTFMEFLTSEDSKSDVQNHDQVEKMKEFLGNQANEKGRVKGESWSLIETHTFLLGLYMFGKNLVLVNKFMGNKGMRNVLFYYYGKFYGSKEHEKWSPCRKNRSKKYVPGKKIFSGWRQQELFSRLFPHVTDECKTTLTEASYMFKDGKLSFEKYVFKVRDMVGVEKLLEALAIGNGKRDLTSPAEMRRQKKKLHPISSSLKTEEIINLLKDRIGLSTAALSQLFWEAVWPRLLKNGWRSELPNFIASQNSKDSLVFLLPGIKKFSRRSLKKGSQYFESFTDVLNKVASEPDLLEPEPHQDRPVNSDQDMDEDQDSVEFTIVETSPDIFGTFLTFREIRISPRSLKEDTNETKVQLEFQIPIDDGARTDQQTGPNGKKLSMRKHSMTEEPLKAVTSRSRNPKKRKERTEDCTKTAFVTSYATSYTENGVARVG